MNWLSASVSDFRLRRKFFSISGNLFLICLLLVIATVTCRPSDEIYDGFDANEDNTQYGDVDNVEFHHVKIVDGIMQEDHHPVIMYKEDFVSEDYDASKNRTAVERKYKDIAHHRRRVHRVNETHKYRALKPKKIYFDILPQTPLVVEDDSVNNDSKFDPSNIRVDVLSLVDAVDKNSPAQENPEQNKQALNKHHPKKYHSRTRRSATDAHAEHAVRKRNPYFLHSSPTSTSVNSLPNVFLLPQSHAGTHVKHQVPGKLWNAINLVVEIPPAVPSSIDDRFGGADNRDIVYWPPSGSGKGTRRPTARPSTSPPLFHDITTVRPTSTRRTQPPLFHDSNPDNADFSVFNNKRRSPPPPLYHDSNPHQVDLSMFSTRRPTTTRRTPPPLFHDSNPENVDFSMFTTRRPNTQSPRPAVTQPPRAQETNTINQVAPTVSQCVWGIVNCCSSQDVEIRYQCFERLGCRGAFWDLNPCANNVKDSIVNYVGDIYD